MLTDIPREVTEIIVLNADCATAFSLTASCKYMRTFLTECVRMHLGLPRERWTMAADMGYATMLREMLFHQKHVSIRRAEFLCAVTSHMDVVMAVYERMYNPDQDSDEDGTFSLLPSGCYENLAGAPNREDGSFALTETKSQRELPGALTPRDITSLLSLPTTMTKDLSCMYGPLAVRGNLPALMRLFNSGVPVIQVGALVADALSGGSIAVLNWLDVALADTWWVVKSQKISYLSRVCAAHPNNTLIFDWVVDYQNAPLPYIHRFLREASVANDRELYEHILYRFPELIGEYPAPSQELTYFSDSFFCSTGTPRQKNAADIDRAIEMRQKVTALPSDLLDKKCVLYAEQSVLYGDTLLLEWLVARYPDICSKGNVRLLATLHRGNGVLEWLAKRDEMVRASGF